MTSTSLKAGFHNRPIIRQVVAQVTCRPSPCLHMRTRGAVVSRPLKSNNHSLTFILRSYQLRSFSTISLNHPGLPLGYFKYNSVYIVALEVILGPFYGAIAVPSVTRCRCRRRCRRRGHRCTGGVRRDSSDTW